MDMFDLIEANENAIVESQGLRADWYEITGVHHDGYIYYLDISARRGSEAEASDIQWFEAEMSEQELRDAIDTIPEDEYTPADSDYY